jgi:hypothetical protein
VLVTAASTYAQWQQVHFPSHQAGAASNSAATADPDGDGRSNFFEYTTGSNPTAHDAAAPFNSQIDGGYMAFTYTRRIGATDAVFTVKQSAGLTSWSNATIAEQATTNNGVVETVTAKVPINGAPRMFLRLEVAQQ